MKTRRVVNISKEPYCIGGKITLQPDGFFELLGDGVPPDIELGLQAGILEIQASDSKYIRRSLEEIRHLAALASLKGSIISDKVLAEVCKMTPDEFASFKAEIKKGLA